MASTTPRAFGLGPLETIVNVGWSIAPPVYVALTVHAGREGLGLTEAPVHDAVFTLSELAVKKGATVVQDVGITASFSGDSQYFKTWVAKVPKFVNGKLFNLVLSGVHHLRDLDTPDYFCGTYTSRQTKTLVETLNFGTILYKYHVVVEYITPAATTTTADFFDYSGTPGLAGVNEVTDNFLSFYDGGELTRTNFSCDQVPPAGKPEDFPFDIQIQVNAIKDHTVTNPGYPYDTSDVVRPAAVFGDRSALWYGFLDANTNPIVSGILDCSLDFTMRNHKLSTVTKDKFIEVYPTSTDSNPARTVQWNAFGRPSLRKNKPLPKITTPLSQRIEPWIDERFDPTFEVKLFSGTAPPTLNFDPFTPVP